MNHQMDTDTKSFAKTVLLLQSGLYVILGLLTMMVMMFIVSGDSTTTKKDVTIPQSIQQNKEIR